MTSNSNKTRDHRHDEPPTDAGPTEEAGSEVAGPDGDDEQNGAGVVTLDVRHLTAEQFARLGLSQIAYVKPVIVNGSEAFAIHAADGTPMALAPDQALAFAAIVQHDMVPALVQ